MTEEAARWTDISKQKIREYKDADGVVNEFALLYDSRVQFPLHYIVFKQVSSHLAHEANSEQLFSRAGSLSPDNGKMSPTHLATWASIAVNYAVFQPSHTAILERYLLKFGRQGRLYEEDVGLLSPDDDGTYNVPDNGSFARFGEPARRPLGEHAGTHTVTQMVAA